MTKNVNIKITGDTSDVERDLANVKSKLDDVSASAAKAAKGTESAGGGMATLTKAAGAFLTLELAKKFFEITDASLRAAKDMKGLSDVSREAAAEYVRSADKAKESMQQVLVSTLAPFMSELAWAAEKASGLWGKVMGVGMNGVTQMSDADLASKAQTLKSQIDALAKQEYKQSGFRVDSEALATARVELREINAEISRRAEELARKQAEEERKKRQEAEAKAREAAAKLKEKNDREIEASRDALGQTDFSEISAAWAQDEKVREDIHNINLSQIDENNKIAEQAAEQEAQNIRARSQLEEYIAKLNEKIETQKKAEAVAAEERALIESNTKFAIEQYALRFQATSTFFSGLSALIARGDMKDKQRRLAYKKAAIAEATAATAVGVTKAYQQGGPLGLITGTGVLMAGMAQVDTIRAQKFAKGGVVRGPDTGDRVAIRANGGEMILTKEQQARLFAMASGGGGGGATITYAPVYQYRASENERRDDYRSFVREVRTATSSPSFNRMAGALL